MSGAEQQQLLGDESYNDDLGDQIDQIPVDIQKKWPADFSALLAIYERELGEMKIDDGVAHKVALRLLLAQSHYFGRRYFYLPGATALKQAVRDYRIYQEYDRGSVKELAQRYDLSVQRIYQIVAEQRDLDIKRMQPGLF